ncbi:RNI-like protein [Dichomitus squalens]|uniref:RNI-like protein n=1 Tax=Dichomitus squalens TaxID=114155 RepID=A0A4Q9NW50_9APHY|nr:RNI-like protein [Dichomitus squalens]TBU63250.1 RNI-like protein [Dichomitus squalens]
MTAYVDALPSDEESCYYAAHLEFRANPHSDAPVSDDALAAVLPHCPHITSAVLGGIRDLSSRTLILLASHADELAHLDIAGCAYVTDLGLKAVATHATALRAINLGRTFSTTDAALAALVRGLPLLEELAMDMLPLVTARATRDVWTYAKRLRRWSLSGCKNVTDSGFPWVPARDALEVAREESSGGRGRHRSWMESLPPLVLPPLYKLHDLRFLDLSHCARLTDAAVLGLVAHAPRISRLNVAGCVELTDRAMHEICKLRDHLSEIDVAGLGRVTDAGVFAIASTCTRLRSVDISFMPRLTDLAIQELATLPRLRRLAAAGLPRVTDQAAFFLAEHARGLAQLHLSFCTRLTLEGVRALLRRLAELEHLSLSGVPALRRRGVSRFSEGHHQHEGHDARKQIHWVFRGEHIRALGAFLEKEEWRKREAERLNILFEPRGDDSRALY